MTPTITAAFFAEGILSPEGSCKSFDASADGFARAEAITAAYLKPLSAAIRDGNAIRAVIRATGSNSDGKGQGMMAPNGEAQEALMRKVYGACGLDPAETAFVEVRCVSNAKSISSYTNMHTCVSATVQEPPQEIQSRWVLLATSLLKRACTSAR